MKRTTRRVSAELRRTFDQDLRLALLVAVLMAVGFGVSLEDDFEVTVSQDLRWPLPDRAGMVLLLVQSLALAFRRIAPVTVLTVNVTAAAVYQALDQRPVPLSLGLLVALYTVAVVRRPLISGVGATVYMVACTAGALSGEAPMTDDHYYTTLVSVVGAVMVGYGVALGRARATLAEQRAAELAREQDARTHDAVMAEQARIAREVHDIVAHDVSVIVAQAAAARRVFSDRPQVATHALTNIESVGRDALDGLRRLVTLLRTEGADPERSPQPSLNRLPWLLAQVERAGLPVDLTIRGRPCPLPATVELNAYRIVQESLTNILKHAGPTRATVVLHYGDENLRVDVRDQGRGASGTPTTGYGLVSMQQRVAMLGGELVAGPEKDRGYRVSARLPVAGATP
jgi:signal transduction histidine kinase